jgi:hypothetical protein
MGFEKKKPRIYFQTIYMMYVAFALHKFNSFF